MAVSILTSNQKLLLNLLSKERYITGNFYLTGGTALTEYYLHHRYSEDLDFFSLKEVDPSVIQTYLKKISTLAFILKIDFQQSFNRNLFFLKLKGEIIKTEFTYYPFSQISKPKEINGILVDSLKDIAVNKTFTIYQQPQSRHFIDLYMIIKSKKWTFANLIKLARIKFDSNIDPIQMTQQLLKVKDVKDYPKMIIKLDDGQWQKFWISEAKKLKKQALTK